MPKFSQKSKALLSTCDGRLQDIAYLAIVHVDFSILEGHRGQIEQNRAYYEGRSRLLWPNSSHNKTPSLAFDAVPYPIDWEDKDRFIHFAGFMLGIAASMGHKLRWGGNWRNDFLVGGNEQFIDYPHFELL